MIDAKYVILMNNTVLVVFNCIIDVMNIRINMNKQIHDEMVENVHQIDIEVFSNKNLSQQNG